MIYSFVSLFEKGGNSYCEWFQSVRLGIDWRFLFSLVSASSWSQCFFWTEIWQFQLNRKSPEYIETPVTWLFLYNHSCRYQLFEIPWMLVSNIIRVNSKLNERRFDRLSSQQWSTQIISIQVSAQISVPTKSKFICMEWILLFNYAVKFYSLEMS